MRQLIAYAKVDFGGNFGIVEEDFKVESKESAEEEIKQVIENFNNYLRPGESKREFHGITRFEEKVIPDKVEVDDEWEDDEDYDEWEDDEDYDDF